MKKALLFISLLSTLVSGGVAFDNNYAKAETIDIEVEQEQIITSTAVASYIMNNLDLLNQVRDENGFHTAVYSAEISDILIDAYYEPELLEGKLLDFDGDKGYLVVGPNNRYYCLAFVGNPPYNAFTSGTKVYETRLGFQYITDMGTTVNLGDENKYNKQDDYENEPSYAGQDGAGECRITDPDAYIADRYGDSDVVEYRWGKSIAYGSAFQMIGYTAEKLSFYTKTVDGVTTYPDMSNYCIAFSIIEYLAYARRKGEWLTAISNNYLPSVSENAYYETRIADGYSSMMRKIKGTQRTYRCHVIDNYGGDTNAEIGLDEVKELIPSQFSDSDGITISGRFTWRTFMRSRTDDYMDLNYPAILDARDTKMYGDHLYAVCGYKRYDKDEGTIGIIGEITVIFLIEVMDGMLLNNQYSTYFDSNRHAKTAYMYGIKFTK